MKIEIRDSTDCDARSYIISQTAPENGFHLTNLPKHRQFIGPLDPDLKQTAKDSIEMCRSAAQSMLSTPIPNPNRMFKHPTGDSENSNVTRINVRRLK